MYKVQVNASSTLKLLIIRTFNEYLLQNLARKYHFGYFLRSIFNTRLVNSP